MSNTPDTNTQSSQVVVEAQGQLFELDQLLQAYRSALTDAQSTSGDLSNLNEEQFQRLVANACSDRTFMRRLAEHVAQDRRLMERFLPHLRDSGTWSTHLAQQIREQLGQMLSAEMFEIHQTLRHALVGGNGNLQTADALVPSLLQEMIQSTWSRHPHEVPFQAYQNNQLRYQAYCNDCAPYDDQLAAFVPRDFSVRLGAGGSPVRVDAFLSAALDRLLSSLPGATTVESTVVRNAYRLLVSDDVWGDTQLYRRFVNLSLRDPSETNPLFLNSRLDGLSVQPCSTGALRETLHHYGNNAVVRACGMNITCCLADIRRDSTGIRMWLQSPGTLWDPSVPLNGARLWPGMSQLCPDWQEQLGAFRDRCIAESGAPRLDAHANFHTGALDELIPRLVVPTPTPGVIDLSSFLAQGEPPTAPPETEAAQGPTADQLMDAIDRMRDRPNDLSWPPMAFDRVHDSIRYYQGPVGTMPQGMHAQFEILDDVIPEQVNPNADEGPH